MADNFKLISLTSIFILIVLMASWIYSQGILHSLIELISPIYLLPEFLSGMMYTSFLTAPFSVGFFFILGRLSNPFIVAAVGGIGSMVADLLIFKFFRFLIFAKGLVLYSPVLITRGLLNGVESAMTSLSKRVRHGPQ